MKKLGTYINSTQAYLLILSYRDQKVYLIILIASIECIVLLSP